MSSDKNKVKFVDYDIRNLSLFDLLELTCTWRQETKDTGEHFYEIIGRKQRVFGFQNTLKQILFNTLCQLERMNIDKLEQLTNGKI